MEKVTSDESCETGHEVKPNITKDVRQVKLQRQWPSSSKRLFQFEGRIARTHRKTYRQCECGTRGIS